MRITNKSSKGFTLIELLVAVAIVVVLAGVLLLAINPASMLQKGRDAKRLEDLDALRKAVQLALVDGEIVLTSTTTCTDCDSGTGTQDADGTGFVKFTIPAGKTGLTKFIPALPQDPTNTGTYIYTYASDGANYEINAVLESTDNASKMSTDGGNAAAVYETGTALDIL